MPRSSLPRITLLPEENDNGDEDEEEENYEYEYDDQDVDAVRIGRKKRVPTRTITTTMTDRQYAVTHWGLSLRINATHLRKLRRLYDRTTKTNVPITRHNDDDDDGGGQEEEDISIANISWSR